VTFFDLSNFTLAAPLLALAAGALVILLLDLILPARAGQGGWYFAGLGAVAVAAWYLVPLWDGKFGPGFNGYMVMDRFAVVFSVVLLGTAFLTLLLSFTRGEEDKSGYLALLLWGAMGMLVMVSATNLMTIFLGIELLSLALYVAVAFDAKGKYAREAAFKYFLLGSVASAFLLFGFALVYGVTGSMSLEVIAKAAIGSSLLYKVGIALSLVGFGFKLALVPFHAWAPDVYEGAPTPVTAYMSVGTKAAAFAAVGRYLIAAVPADTQNAMLLPMAVLAAASMLLGATVGIWQTDLKRLMAYSGIAHAGYLIMGLVGLGADGMSAAAYYLAAYGFTAMGIFAIITLLESEGEEGSKLSVLSGLFYRRPALGAAMAILMFALAGLPPTGGFVGKVLLAMSAVKGIGTFTTNAWIVLIGLMVSTGISAYVYLKVIGTVFKKPAEGVSEAKARMAGAEGDLSFAPGTVRTGVLAVLIISVIGVLALGILPGPVVDLLKITF
jgi:NADH-quinone oxidoreductase subunit N